MLLFTATPAAHADAITDWNANAGAGAVAACLAPDGDPLHESRLYAMVHLAAHDAVNAIQRHSHPYAYDAIAGPDASADAAVAAAAHDVLVSQIPLTGVPAECVSAGVARVESDYGNALAAIPEGASKTRGIALGKAAAAAIVARRANDGSTAPMIDPGFAQGAAPGEWRFTPGSPPVAFGAAWAHVKPFALRNAAQFRPGPPLAVRCDAGQHAAAECRKYAADLEEVRRLGSDGVSAPSARNREQTEIALFWMESSPHAWNRIARTVSASQRLDMWQNARLFALLNVAQADGYVASWATKFHYRFWRPVTAIREAGADGNPRTIADAGWMSLRPTPPVPDYESAHALEGAAAAQVMKRVFGRDNIAFDACSFTLPAGSTCTDANAVRRKFRSFSEAAAENGDSRVFIGFHFRDAVRKGLAHGQRIGDWTVANALQWEQHTDRAAPAFAQSSESSLPASSAIAEYKDVSRIAAAEGVVEAVRQSTLAAQVVGRIVALNVRAGDAVRAGQVLVQIDPRSAAQAEAASQSQVREARANLANARAKYERSRQLFAQKFISQAAFDQAETEYVAAQEQTSAAVANAGQAATSKTYTTITAPYAGVVASTEVEVGDMATPGKALLTLFDPRELRVTATLPQAVLAQARLDAPVTVEIPTLSRTLLSRGAIVVPIADTRAHTTRVRLALPESAGLLPGQYARAQFVTGRTHALAIPVSAVLRRSEVTAVYVLDLTGAARLRQVRLGEPAGDGLVEVLAGLEAGERVSLEPVRAGIEASRRLAIRSS
ncbi:MAG TPA: efflux RND transporter periplasmic adaptor subunit [Casimicrobiaceae bacterium]|nr:efflux RND transporter periplasmic adaptor subunit [Casimicrobiaceae bacterium]